MTVKREWWYQVLTIPAKWFDEVVRAPGRDLSEVAMDFAKEDLAMSNIQAWGDNGFELVAAFPRGDQHVVLIFKKPKE